MTKIKCVLICEKNNNDEIKFEKIVVKDKDDNIICESFADGFQEFQVSKFDIVCGVSDKILKNKWRNNNAWNK